MNNDNTDQSSSSFDPLTYTFACDESGDPSLSFRKGASRYFVAAIIGTRRPQVIRSTFDSLKLENNLPMNYEFKYHDLSSSGLQERVFARIGMIDFECWVIHVDKPGLPDVFRFMTGLDRYLYFLTEVIRILPESARSRGTLILDEYGENARLSTEIRRVMKTRGITPGFKRCISRDSKDEPLIQLADLIAGAVSHRDSGKRNDHYSIIERKIVNIIEYPPG